MSGEQEQSAGHDARPRRTGIVLQPGHEAHETGTHPENSERLTAVEQSLRAGHDWERLAVFEARAAGVEDIARVHTSAHIDFIHDQSVAGPCWIDGDTRVSPGTYEVTMRASGAALVAVDAVAGARPAGDSTRPDSLFALIRPPGHHATADRAMGFCMFNHAAVAARYAREVLGIERVAILDWDVHHGNGTQDIFESDPSVLFVSMHQWPLYPGSGWVDEVGSGPGRGFTVNVPMPPGSGNIEHVDAFDRVAGPVIDAFDPGLLIVSAGQDGHQADPLSDQALTVAGFGTLASRAAGLASRRGIGLVALHEGGYNPETLPILDHAILAGFGGFPTGLFDRHTLPQAADGAGGPVADWAPRLEQVLEAQRPFWGAAFVQQ
jgi:acetoin utilization deacetylase AcuC-like enzyme